VLQETKDVVPRKIIDDMYRSTRIEKDGFTVDDPAGADSYLQLIDLKTVAPIRACLLLNGVKGDADKLASLATGLGRAIQMLDDLLDLNEDLKRGKLFITREELSLSGITAAELPENIDRVAKLRCKWVMANIWPAHAAANALLDSGFGLAARSWFE